jgi:hypothetical protein
MAVSERPAGRGRRVFVGVIFEGGSVMGFVFSSFLGVGRHPNHALRVHWSKILSVNGQPLNNERNSNIYLNSLLTNNNDF